MMEKQQELAQKIRDLSANLAERERQSRVLDLLRQVLQHFIASQDIVATTAYLLDGMLLLTESAYGFIGEVLHEPDGTPWLRIHALTDIAWNEDTRRLYDDAQARGMEFRSLDTLFGVVLRTGELVIANDPANDPRRGGLPEGHPPLDAFLGMPIRYGNMLVGMVGLANRPGGYDESLADFLGLLTATYASILEAARLRHFNQVAINELQSAREAAEGANRAKSEFLAGWAQDLRTPLNAVLGHAQILLMNDALDAEARQQAEEIAQGGEQLVSLIGDMLERISADEAPAARPKPKVEAERNVARRRILIAEDNPANQAVLRMQLEVLGFNADIAADGAAGLAKWKAGGHDLILVDRNMPGMDGLALARAIRNAERESGSCVPIITISAGNSLEELIACREAGMDDVLPKPIQLDDLHRMLARWLPRSLPFPPADDAPKPAAPASGAILDAACLARIVGGVNIEQVHELVDLFTATAHDDLSACRQLLKERDGRGLALAMHKLKSSARSVGAMRFAQLAETLEYIARGGQLEATVALLAELEYAVNDIEAAMRQLAVSPAPTLVADAMAMPVDAVLPRSVLVVDDDPVALRQIGMLLSSLGIAEVLAAEDVEAALAEMARANACVDLLISDLNMPGIDGIEFLRRLAETGYRGCLILSSCVDERLLQAVADLARAKGLSLRGTLKKPVTREALRQLLANSSEKPAASTAPRGRMATSPNEIMESIRRNEFDVQFQPKADAATLCVVGVEALARWERDGRLVPPDVFIGAAERHGLIGPLSELLVTKAVIGGARLAEAGFPLNVAVNLSANWLTDVRLPEFIIATLQATDFKAENLTLEITETGAMADLATALDVMTRLRLKGVKLSIDDFGTGYSSMAQLQRIPFGELKLDRSFVRGAAEKITTRIILAASIEMALKLNLTTVAEGVETQADLDLVRGLGCDQVQGWLIAKAMPLEALIEWLKDRQGASAS